MSLPIRHRGTVTGHDERCTPSLAGTVGERSSRCVLGEVEKKREGGECWSHGDGGGGGGYGGGI